MSLDAIIARLQNIPGWNVNQVSDLGEPVPWYQVRGASLIPDLVIQDGNLLEQVQTVSAQIMHWGRLAAQCKRVWEIQERKYRIWRDGTALALVDPIGKPDGWKKPTQDVVDKTIRTLPEYVAWYERLEVAEEAHMACTAVLEGFRAKKDMLRASVVRHHENAAPTLGI